MKMKKLYIIKTIGKEGFHSKLEIAKNIDEIRNKYINEEYSSIAIQEIQDINGYKIEIKDNDNVVKII